MIMIRSEYSAAEIPKEGIEGSNSTQDCSHQIGSHFLTLHACFCNPQVTAKPLQTFSERQVMVTSFRFVFEKNKLVSEKKKMMMLLFVCVLLILIVSPASVDGYLSPGSQVLRGSAIKCQNEGKIVKVSLLSDDPCITCKCFNKEIVCQREICPNFKSCYLLSYGKNRTCCDTCKECWYNGKSYKSGQSFTDEKDSCKNFICNAGVITEYRPECHVDCKNPTIVKGQCCPSCNKCEFDGKFYKDGEVIHNNDRSNDCMKCECVEGYIVCSKPPCPVLPCPQSKWMVPKNECCPICKGHKKVNELENKCMMGSSVYQHGQSYEFDQCTRCYCNGTTNICSRKVCPTLECPPSYQLTEPGECCSKCQEAQEVRMACLFAGQDYKNGEKWKMDNCHRCSCINGEVRCVAEICSKNVTCPDKHKSVRLRGECCSSCVEEDAQCKITNNLTLYQTFDKKVYEFAGQCNYILAKDCGKTNLFAVHLVNRKNMKSAKINPKVNISSAAIHSIMIRIEEIKVRMNRLGRVRVGSRRVRLPHIKLGTLSIVQDGRRIVLRANIGLKVVWDHGKTIEITVPTTYKSKSCGLCGNYNGNPEDDYMTKRKLVVNEVEKFAYAWRVGNTDTCYNRVNSSSSELTSEVTTCSNSWEKNLDAIHVCNILKSPLFRSCHSAVSITSYFGKCKKDICSCTEKASCHCNAIEAYVKQCRKLGVHNPNWKKKALCQGTSLWMRYSKFSHENLN